MIAEILFWVAAGLAAYTYAGYPLALALAVLVRGKPRAPEAREWPKVTALVVAHNEADRIAGKVRNILENGYPGDLEVIVCSDGSTDRTNEIVEAFGDPRVHLAASPSNIGVNEAFALGAKQATGEVFLMTDSGALFEPGALGTAARHFADREVGFVSGRIVFENPLGSAIGSGYRSYWSIETGVRRLESHLGLGVVTVGAFEMVRRDAYISVPSRVSNDLIAPMYAHSLGLKCRYEPDALLVTPQKKSPGQDFARRIRMAVRGWSSLSYIRKHVPPLRNPGSWLALISHKYLRWGAGMFLIGLFAANALTLNDRFYQVTFALQVLAYGSALVGWALSARGKHVQPFSAAFYFCLLHLAGLAGLLQALLGRRIATWKPVD